MKLIKFQEFDHGVIYTCPDCGFKTGIIKHEKITEKVVNDIERRHNISCSKTHTMLEKGVNFGKAALKDLIQGMPRCSQEEIDRRLNICKLCPLYREDGDQGVCTHSSCGCHVSNKLVYLNKLAWESQHCPIGKW